jgi:hypothetical protein
MFARTRRVGVALVVGLAPAAFADAPPSASVYAGVEIANTDSRRVDLGGSARFAGAWSANAALARADVELPDTNTQSTLAAVKLSYDFGRFGLGAGFRHGEIDGVSVSRGWLVTASTEYREWRFGAEIEARETRLEPAAFTEDFGTGIGVVSGTSRCSVDGGGYQGRVDLDRPTWSAYAAARVFDYGAYDCALEITAGGGPPGNGLPPQARGRALGRRLAAGSLDAALGAASRLAPRETALLQSSLSLGFTTPVSARWIGGIELYRDVEKLDGSEYLTGVLFADTRLGDTWTLELSAGYSAAELIDDSAFAGVRVTAAL